MSDQKQALQALEIPIVGFATFLALSTGALLAGLQWQAEFKALQPWIAGSALIAIAAMIPGCLTQWRSIRAGKTDGWPLLAALGVCFVYAVAAVVINRPDIDDSIYVPKSLAYVENPLSRLDLTVHWLADLPSEIVVLDLHWYEIVQAVTAAITGRHYLDIYHLAFPAIAGFLMAAAFLLLISRFEPDPWKCVLSIAFLLIVALALGETHFSFGNVSVARFFHGKYVMLAAFAPAWTYFSLRYLDEGRAWHWGFLALFSIAIAGSTTTAFIFLPLLSVVLAAAHQFSSPRPFGRFGRSIAYGLALTPLVLLAFRYLLIAASDLGPGTMLNEVWPTDVFEQLGALYNDRLALTFILLFAATIIVLWKSPHRLFFALWIGGAVLLILNPISGQLLMDTIAPPAIYWRLFYVLPFPLVVALAFALLLREKLLGRLAAVASFAAIAILCVRGPTSIIRPANGAIVEWPNYKIAPATRQAVAALAASSSGTMFAPLEISSNLLLMTATVTQYHVRDDWFEFILAKAGASDVFTHRRAVYSYLYAGNDGAREAAISMLREPTRPATVVIRDEDAERVSAVLNAHGYQADARQYGGYLAFRDGGRS